MLCYGPTLIPALDPSSRPSSTPSYTPTISATGAPTDVPALTPSIAPTPSHYPEPGIPVAQCDTTTSVPLLRTSATQSMVQFRNVGAGAYLISTCATGSNTVLEVLGTLHNEDNCGNGNERFSVTLPGDGSYVQVGIRWGDIASRIQTDVVSFLLVCPITDSPTVSGVPTLVPTDEPTTVTIASPSGAPNVDSTAGSAAQTTTSGTEAPTLVSPARQEGQESGAGGGVPVVLIGGGLAGVLVLVLVVLVWTKRRRNARAVAEAKARVGARPTFFNPVHLPQNQAKGLGLGFSSEGSTTDDVTGSSPHDHVYAVHPTTAVDHTYASMDPSTGGYGSNEYDKIDDVTGTGLQRTTHRASVLETAVGAPPAQRRNTLYEEPVPMAASQSGVGHGSGTLLSGEALESQYDYFDDPVGGANTYAQSGAAGRAIERGAGRGQLMGSHASETPTTSDGYLNVAGSESAPDDGTYGTPQHNPRTSGRPEHVAIYDIAGTSQVTGNKESTADAATAYNTAYRPHAFTLNSDDDGREDTLMI
eukprot:m.1376009 g.1376009  ORF g.1376009 m.1376009 type:complete len:532 (+) comp24962_c1_seq13:283-1878(+)